MSDEQTIGEKIQAIAADKPEHERSPDGTITATITDETGYLHLRQFLADGVMQTEGHERVEFEVSVDISSGDLILRITDATYRIALQDIMREALRYHLDNSAEQGKE